MSLKNTKILIFVAPEFEDSELIYPKYRMLEAGAKVVIAGPEAKVTYKGKHGNPCQSDVSFMDVKPKDFDALIIPGGYAPDKIRNDPNVQKITKKLFEEGKLIAFICHAGWVPISAQIIKGIKCTSYFTIKDDLINAGAKWVDEPVVIDRNVISSRSPDDLPFFCPAIINYLTK